MRGLIGGLSFDLVVDLKSWLDGDARGVVASHKTMIMQGEKAVSFICNTSDEELKLTGEDARRHFSVITNACGSYLAGARELRVKQSIGYIHRPTADVMGVCDWVVSKDRGRSFARGFWAADISE